MDVADRLEAAYRASAGEAGVETQTLEGDVHLIKKLLKEDAEFFIEFFLQDALDMPVPEFHKEIWGLLTNLEKQRILLAIPRDHAKTTLAKLAVPWYWLFTSHRFAVYLSNTAPIAKGACRDIIEFLNQDNFIQIFGKIRMIKQSETEGLWVFDLPLGMGRTKRCILRGLGQGQQMRGINIDNQRPDIAIIDDVEDNENTESEFQQKKLDKWMFGPFLKALARRKKIIWLGNMLSKTCLLARLSRAVRWNPVVFGCLIKDVATGVMRPLWPDKWSVAELQEDFKEYKESGLVETWMCEMMNMPGHGENGFTADVINYQAVPTPGECAATWISIDPAFGERSHNDETCIAVHAIPKDGRAPMTVDTYRGRFDEHVMFTETLRMATAWNAWVWGIEAVAAQKVLITLFTVLLSGTKLQGRVTMLPLVSGRGDPKVSRIRAFVALMAHKEWAIPDNDVDITTQILNFDVRKKIQEDDVIDSVAYGPPMMEQFLPIIEAAFNQGSFDFNTTVQVGMEVASV